jgi:hypothetical protein
LFSVLFLGIGRKLSCLDLESSSLSGDSNAI